MERWRSGHPQIRRARFRLFAVFAVFVIAMSGGCSIVDRPKLTPASEATQTPPSAVRVRAQSEEPPTGSVAPPSSPVASNLAASRIFRGGALDTALESLFGEASTSDWTPLSFATLFTEGWNQPFVFSPPSDSGALRQEWINAANGVFYRQSVLNYNFRDQATSAGNRNIGTFTIFAPLSRRLELNISIPFVDDRAVAHSSASGGSRASLNSRTSYQSTFGDFTITPQVMLSETRNTSIMSVLAIRTPTGSRAAGDGGTSLGPQLQFWQGLPNRWVVRGGAGPTVPLTATGLHTTFDTNLTIGRFLTLDDARYFKQLSVWVAANNSAAMDHSGPAVDFMTILPGIRFLIAKNTWFLYGVEIPLVAPRNEDYGMYFSLVRRW